MTNPRFTKPSVALVTVFVSLNFATNAFGQKEYSYKNEYSTGDEAQRQFGMQPYHSRNNPKLDAGNFKFELGSKLECGKLDVTANVRGQFKELQDQLFKLIPQKASEAALLLERSAFTVMCYAYPTICAQLRNDWLSIQGKLNLRAQACAAVDKFIDNQAEKGSRQLKSEAVAKSVQNKVGTPVGPTEWDGVYDVSMALKSCQEDKTGLALRDFQTGMMRC